MTLFLVAPGQTTLPIAILQYLQWRIDPTIAAVSLLQILLIGAGMLITDRYVKLTRVLWSIRMARLQLTGLTKTYGDFRAVAGVDLDIAQGELVVLLGPSGCGKTTTLRMIAGFVAPTAGEIRLGGRDITRQPPWKRNTGLVFQSYALFPHLTVAENIAFGLRMRKLPQTGDRRQARGGPAPRAPRRPGGPPAARIVGRPAAARGAGRARW